MESTTPIRKIIPRRDEAALAVLWPLLAREEKHKPKLPVEAQKNAVSKPLSRSKYTPDQLRAEVAKRVGAMSHSQIAAELNCSRPRVTQIIADLRMM